MNDPTPTITDTYGLAPFAEYEDLIRDARRGIGLLLSFFSGRLNSRCFVLLLFLARLISWLTTFY